MTHSLFSLAVYKEEITFVHRWNVLDEYVFVTAGTFDESMISIDLFVCPMHHLDKLDE